LKKIYYFCTEIIPIHHNTKTRMIGSATVKEAFGSMTELAAKKNVSAKAG
jgi:hypothetical protein